MSGDLEVKLYRNHSDLFVGKFDKPSAYKWGLTFKISFSQNCVFSFVFGVTKIIILVEWFHFSVRGLGL